mgnify:FL=1
MPRQPAAARMFRIAALALALAALSASLPLAAQSVPTRLCFNESLGPPDGAHPSLELMRGVQRAVPEAAIALVPVPWRRCVLGASRGDFDGSVGASFTPERGLALVYPRNADGEPDSARRMFSLSYRVLRRIDGPLRWDGVGFFGIDGAIGVERGHATGTLVAERGALADDSHPDVDALLAKVRAGRLAGALLAEPLVASLAARDGGLDGLQVEGPPMAPRDYHLAFSRGFAAAHPALVDRLWDAVATEREARTPPALRDASVAPPSP